MRENLMGRDGSKACGVACCDRTFATAQDAQDHEEAHLLLKPVDPFEPKRDPNQQFVISAIARGGVVAEINGHLEALELPQRITVDDERLTDALCQEYADVLHTADCSHDFNEDVYLDDQKAAVECLARKVGLLS